MHIRYLQDPLCAIAVIGLVIGSGCGGVSHQAPPDAVADSSAPPDAPLPDAAPAPRCDPAKPFGAPALILGINSNVRDQGAELIDDLTIIFGSERSPGTGLYMATRSTPTSPFGTPAPITAINATGGATGPTLTADGLTMYYALTTAADPGDIYVTHRNSRADAFVAGTRVTGVNSTGTELDPFISADGSTLYFDSTQATGAALHLYVALRQPSGSFATPQALTAFNTSAVDGHPVLSPDGLTLYWSSTRTDDGPKGGTDIWSARRTSTAGEFAGLAPVAELNSPMNESMSWVSPDSCMVLLQSDRPDGVGLQDIYQAIRPL
jgi:Tol biopolymer transport system component